MKCKSHRTKFNPAFRPGDDNNFLGMTYKVRFAMQGYSSMFRRSYVQKVLCSEGSMSRRSLVQKVLFSEGSMFRRSYVLKVLCPEGP